MSSKRLKRILIVDDHSEVRRMLRSGLETLGPEFELLDLPSGEEAYLEITRQPVHLLIADVRLAGMTGLELKDKILSRNPQSKIILITGVTDPGVRQQVADAGADAFFIKPIPMPEFLEAVTRCLGELSQTEPHPASEVPQTNISTALLQRITTLRHEIKAISVVLMDLQGGVLVTSGDLPDSAINSKIAPTLLTACQTSAQISHYLDSKAYGNLLCFEGGKYDLALTHVGDSHALLVATNKGVGSEYLGTIGFNLHMAAKDLLAVLENLPRGALDTADRIEPLEKADHQPDEDTHESQVPLEALFQNKSGGGLDPEQIEDYWDNLVADKESNAITNRDVISFDQARELGLEPEQDED